MAAKPISSAYDKNGKVVVTYDDKTKKTFLAPFAQAEKLLPQDISPGMTSTPGTTTAVDSAGGYGGSGAGAFTTTGATAQMVTDVATGIQSSAAGGVPYYDAVTKTTKTKTIGELIGAARLPDQYKAIKNALISSNLIGKNTKSQTAVQAAWLQVLIGSQTAQVDPFQYMKSMNPGADATSTGPSTNISTRTYTADGIRSVADQIFVSQLGRKVTDADLAKITAALNTKEKASPTKTVSTPNAAGNVTNIQTSGGVDEAGLITKQAQAMPEYQRAQNINFSSWLDKAMTKGQPSIGSLLNG